MANKNNATCSICGNGYYACLACRDSIKLSPWKIHCDTSEHYKVFQIVRGFSTGVYTKDEAREKLKNVDLRDVESFRPHIKKIVKDILKSKEEKTVVETVKKTECVNVKKDNSVKIEDKTTMSRKKNYKVEVE